MCGFAGLLSSNHDMTRPEIERSLGAMASSIRHRGPDSNGFWLDLNSGIGLAHQRLAILDLSSAGHQPMHSVSGRYVIVFNGEIYNHQKVRKSIERQYGEGSRWIGHSDTETLLAGFEAWGVQSTLERCTGMFGFALWDNAEKILTLARDRLGEKPVYYGWQGVGQKSVFLFGSELSALRQHPRFESQINRDSVSALLQYGCIGGERSIYTGIKKLMPGQMLTVSLARREPALHKWWSGAKVAVAGLAHPFRGSEAAAIKELETILMDSIKDQMLADVPVGAFLSGGIDSSLIVALMQAQSTAPVRTFTIGFDEAAYNEAGHAKAVAKHLGTDHTELYLSPTKTLEVIPKLPLIYSEPFADSSQIPTFLVSQLAQQHVRVALSGDAGDELFCGYRRYQLSSQFWKRISWLPIRIRKILSQLLLQVQPHTYDKLGGSLLRNHAIGPQVGDKIHKGALLLDSPNINTLYQNFVSHWKHPSDIVIGSRADATLYRDVNLSGLAIVEQMMAKDMLGYLPDDILVKVDRAAMATSLETRAPFLNHKVVEFAWSLPLRYKFNRGQTKWPLRKILNKHVPSAIINRPKMGFGVPIDIWLRGPLREWAEALLSEQRLKNEGYFLTGPIRQKWSEHLSGRRNWQHQIWSILMFQSWLEAQDVKQT